MKIALDLDGVLADLSGSMVDHTEYEQSNFDNFGQWDDFEHFMAEAERVWSDHWADIDAVEPDIKHKVALLSSDHTVDIVTNTAGNPKQVAWWLIDKRIEYDDIVHARRNGVDKSDLEYDCYIDDKPSMVGDVSVLYLRDQQWNQHQRGSSQYIYHSYEPSYIDSEGLPEGHFRSETPHVIRVTDLHDVLFDLDRQ